MRLSDDEMESAVELRRIEALKRELVQPGG